MNQDIIQVIAKEKNIQPIQIENTLALLEEGNTVPFIARYRKEMTMNLDEEQIIYIQKQYEYQIKLKERKEAVLASIEQQGKLTEEIKKDIAQFTKLSQVEDYYKPYAQKKKTRAGVAIKNGLEPLANWVISLPTSGSLQEQAIQYLNEEVKDINSAIQGAKDIIAEMVSDNAKQRWAFKESIITHGLLTTKLKKNAQDEKKVYQNYYEYEERVKTLADHRIMAINRAEKEKVITVSFNYDKEFLQNKAFKNLVKNKETIVSKELKEACDDGCTRLLFPSIEREIRNDLSERAQMKSIEIFSTNLEKLLLQPPLKGRVVLGFDPGFYNGCKLAVIDETGKMLTVNKIYPFRKQGSDTENSKRVLAQMIQKYHVEIIAIGNGTASRESEKLVAEMIREYGLDVSYAIVSEAGASVWSAQEAARQEFPDIAVEERSAVSIGRRLLDPLAELIKIDPKSIGVGQYQHDLPPKALNERLDEAIMKCVNRTGADLNTASQELLAHISGLNSSIAKEIIQYRNEHGKFTNRNQLLKVKKLGQKTYTQCAGFLRISDGQEPLDQTSIHPESYEIAKKIMKLSNISTLGQSDISFANDKIKQLDVDEYTLKDIKDAITQPLRDYRDQFDGALLKSDVLDISDLSVGDKLSGTIRNVVDFGAFVDIGLHEDGLVHISRMAKTRVHNPNDVVSVNDIVDVWVYEIDTERSRVSLSLLSPQELEERQASFKHRKSRRNKR